MLNLYPTYIPSPDLSNRERHFSEMNRLSPSSPRIKVYFYPRLKVSANQVRGRVLLCELGGFA